MVGPHLRAFGVCVLHPLQVTAVLRAAAQVDGSPPPLCLSSYASLLLCSHTLSSPLLGSSPLASTYRPFFPPRFLLLAFIHASNSFPPFSRTWSTLACGPGITWPGLCVVALMAHRIEAQRITSGPPVEPRRTGFRPGLGLAMGLGRWAPRGLCGLQGHQSPQ